MEMRIVILAICVAFAAAKTSKFHFLNPSLDYHDYYDKLGVLRTLYLIDGSIKRKVIDTF